VIDIRIGTTQNPSPSPRIEFKVPNHIFMNFLLQIDAHAAIGSDDFIRAHAGVRRHVPARIGNTDACRVVANNVVSAFDGSGN
jgi:hypothetical protein